MDLLPADWHQPGPRSALRRRVLSHLGGGAPVLLFTADVLALALGALLAPMTATSSLVLGLVTVLLLQSQALYRSRLTLSVADDLPGLSIGLGPALVVSALVAQMVDEISWSRVILSGAVTFTLLVLARAAAYAVVRFARTKGWVSHRTLILGTGPTAARLGQVIMENPDLGLSLVGYVGPPKEFADGVQRGVLATDMTKFSETADRYDVNVVLVTQGGVRAKEVVHALRHRGRKSRYTIFLIPPLFQMVHTRHGDRMRDVALIRLRAGSAPLARAIKRGQDVALALGVLLLVSPLLVVLGLLAKLSTGGVLFRQTRVGREGKLFRLYKFQSMRPEDERISRRRWNVAGDGRVTPVGRFLRRTSLDELPQLINVVRGDMSLVGPRPERPYFVERFNEKYDDSYPMRHRVRPGLTGWAAVNGLRGDTSIEERAYFDNVYIDNWSLWLDVQITARTVTAVLGAQGR